MILVDTALERRVRDNNPIRLALVGAGYTGRQVAYQVITAFPGIRLIAIANRTQERAEAAYHAAGVERIRRVADAAELEAAVSDGDYAVTAQPSALWEASSVDVVLECTGTIEFGARVALESVRHGKHVVLLNAELDATVGPILKHYADAANVVITNTDGDEPGLAMNLIRFVRAIGLRPALAGNLKGLYDPYRNPETQREFARRHNQKPAAVTSFADGTKLSMELTVIANATGFGVGRRGGYGPSLEDVHETPAYYADKLRDGGMVDFICGAKPYNGVYVLACADDPARQEYMQYVKMGDGPLYLFYTPFNLPQLEVPLTVARAALFQDAAVTPLGRPVCDAVAVAKRDLNAGETLDGAGGFTCYALVENCDVACEDRLLPMGVSEGCRLTRSVPRDQAISYEDVELPRERLCDRLRAEQASFLPNKCVKTRASV